jgi:uncharacterized membrane protein
VVSKPDSQFATCYKTITSKILDKVFATKVWKKRDSRNNIEDRYNS